MFTAYHVPSSTYRSIPRASQICVVESLEELRRLFDAVWDTIEKGKWIHADDSTRKS